MNQLKHNYSLSYHDPYDFWASPKGVKIRKSFYTGKLSGKFNAAFYVFVDWLMPEFLRTQLKTQFFLHPITLAQLILCHSLSPMNNFQKTVLAELLFKKSVYGKDFQYHAWGLDMPWMSKNGYYGKNIPFVTHTPYAMEAMIELARDEIFQKQALEYFNDTLRFLDSLKIMYEDEKMLAVSYGPVHETRIVINANAYAAFAYSLHARYGEKEIKTRASETATRITKWVIDNQKNNGSWTYYSDTQPGNFIDCFHSCLVIKNLIKIKKNLPSLEPLVTNSIGEGWEYVQDRFFNKNYNLVRRFVVRDIKDPYRWDLYDQAEYLGLLIDFDLKQKAENFAETVVKKFKKNNAWYCKIDFLGRQWGKNFLRWGIVPFWYQQSRLINLLNK